MSSIKALPKHLIKNPIFHFIIIIYHLLLVQSVDERYEACDQPKTCGTNPPITIRYPFYLMHAKPNFCGHPGFQVTCKENKTIIYNTSHGEYIIKNISYENRSFRIVNSRVLNSKCIPRLNYFALDRSPFILQNYVDLKLLYSCNNSFLQSEYGNYQIPCDSNKSRQSYAVLDPEKRIKCEKMPCYCVAVPVELEGSKWNESLNDQRDYMITKLLENGFTLKWNIGISCSKCEGSGGRCGYDANNGTVCFCSDRPHKEYCRDGKS